MSPRASSFVRCARLQRGHEACLRCAPSQRRHKNVDEPGALKLSCQASAITAMQAAHFPGRDQPNWFAGGNARSMTMPGSCLLIRQPSSLRMSFALLGFDTVSASQAFMLERSHVAEELRPQEAVQATTTVGEAPSSRFMFVAETTWLRHRTSRARRGSISRERRADCGPTKQRCRRDSPAER